MAATAKQIPPQYSITTLFVAGVAAERSLASLSSYPKWRQIQTMKPRPMTAAGFRSKQKKRNKRTGFHQVQTFIFRNLNVPFMYRTTHVLVRVCCLRGANVYFITTGDGEKAHTNCAHPSITSSLTCRINSLLCSGVSLKSGNSGDRKIVWKALLAPVMRKLP
ncbi:hypothetical protein F5B22DRAFT_57763 [Xylaria bambusicola]|uniref:uncharacterized protein n=1 Tax=Xylaria bambusicola TaxID=326684 RepID=UPI0020080BD1|nr:uncharacterized protein F5B22DRAFT_57763 [Xylaria bambusicola]KAI0502771.1 hypothetical protein F5B22DRAFT_57763 [Xylaria bambusicola]